MRKTPRAITTAVLAAVMVVGGMGSASALQATGETPGTPTLDSVKEWVVARAEARIARFERRIEVLDGREGPRAVQSSALFAEGITIVSEMIDEVTGAEDFSGVWEAVREARAEYREHRRVRLGYAHVEADITRFTRRADRLDTLVDRAADAGLDTTGAAAEAEAARADLDSAAELLAGIDPSATGPEVLEQITGAHRSAHAAREHVRAGLAALREARLDGTA
jgi:hypothetical protein